MSNTTYTFGPSLTEILGSMNKNDNVYGPTLTSLAEFARTKSQNLFDQNTAYRSASEDSLDQSSIIRDQQDAYIHNKALGECIRKSLERQVLIDYSRTLFGLSGGAKKPASAPKAAPRKSGRRVRAIQEPEE